MTKIAFLILLFSISANAVAQPKWGYSIAVLDTFGSSRKIVYVSEVVELNSTTCKDINGSLNLRVTSYENCMNGWFYKKLEEVGIKELNNCIISSFVSDYPSYASKYMQAGLDPHVYEQSYSESLFIRRRDAERKRSTAIRMAKGNDHMIMRIR